MNLIYCIRGYFCGGFIFANFASQNLAKISTYTFSNGNIRKIAKLKGKSSPELP